MSKTINRRLTRELKSIIQNPLTNPRVYTTPLEHNILEWHYVIEGSRDTPYEGGFYWGKLIFPKEYPLKPPSVIMLTPNGRFRTGKKLCLSMSDFHPGECIQQAPIEFSFITILINLFKSFLSSHLPMRVIFLLTPKRIVESDVERKYYHYWSHFIHG